MIKIGVLTDMSPFYADYGNTGSITAAQMVVADSGVAGKAQVFSADALNKPDNAFARAHQWFSPGVEAIFDMPTSIVALIVKGAARRSYKLVFLSTTINDRITKEEFNDYSLAWVWNT